MRPLYHPPLEAITVQGILDALSDPTRACIFRQLADSDCGQNCVTYQNAGGTPVAKSTLSHHFKILREAGLIRSWRKGVELQSRTRCDEIKERFGPMINAILAAYERESGSKPEA